MNSKQLKKIIKEEFNTLVKEIGETDSPVGIGSGADNTEKINPVQQKKIQTHFDKDLFKNTIKSAVQTPDQAVELAVEFVDLVMQLNPEVNKKTVVLKLINKLRSQGTPAGV